MYYNIGDKVRCIEPYPLNLFPFSRFTKGNSYVVDAVESNYIQAKNDIGDLELIHVDRVILATTVQTEPVRKVRRLIIL